MAWGNINVSGVNSAADIGAIDINEKGVAGGVATLDEDGKLAQMPSAADIDAAPANLYGTEELVEGESTLAAGVIYCMYEE